MKPSPYLLVFIALLCTKSICFSQEKNSNDSVVVDQKSEIVSEFGGLSSLHIGYYGTTQNCLPFNVYGFKYKRTWFLIAAQNTSSTYLVIKPPRTSEDIVYTGSDFLFTGIAKSFSNNYLELKNRRRTVKDIQLYGFYKFNKPGKKAIKGLLYIEYPDLEAEGVWPFKWLSGKAEEATKSLDSVIPEINTEVTLPPEPTLPPIPVP